MPLLAAGLVALNPQFLFVAALVTNDALLAALSAALLWLVAGTKGREPGSPAPASDRITNNSWPIRGAVALGVVVGLALLTKQSAIILVPVALAALVARPAGERARPAIEETGGRIGGGLRARLARRSGLLDAALMIAIVALVAGWWYARNQRLYGDLFGLAAFRGEFATQPFDIASLAAWLAALGQLHASLWGRFGWMNVAPPAWAIWPIGAIELAAVGGLLRAAVRADRASVVGHWALVALPVLALAWMVSFAVTAGLVAWQGRLLFPALPAIAVLLARGLLAWAEPSGGRTRDAGAQGIGLRTTRNTLIIGSVLGSLFLLAAWMPGNVIRPAYPPQTLPEQVALAQAGNNVIFRFRRRGERSINLRGWRISAPAQPGATLDLTLTWNAASRQVRDWVVFVQLVDAQGRAVAEAHGEPRDGAFPTTQWNIDDWIADRHLLQLPADLAGGEYTLRIWLQDALNNQRAEVRIDEARPLGNTLDLGSIIVEAGG